MTLPKELDLVPTHSNEEFRLPQYIAARFNLHIFATSTRGFSWAPAPSLTPDSPGPLLIPLHNLTDNDYNIPGGDPIIWVEFTKLSPLPYWARDVADIDQRPPRRLRDLPR